MSSLRSKLFGGLFWSLLDNFSKQGLNFIVTIILARLLSPKEFGLIGMLTIFIAVSQSIIDSGFSQALIRKKDCTKKDYSTVFLFNIFIGFLLYFVIYISAPAIGKFYEEPVLVGLIRVLALGLIFNSASLIQRTILIKEINFKTQTKVSFLSSLVSGIIGIILALLDYGVWSLVFKMVLGYAATAILFWSYQKWRPVFLFSWNSFKELFGFGSKLLISGIIDTAFRNVFYLVIGKYFSASQLGYYTKADQFNNLASQNITAVIQRVSYPILASIQDEKERLKISYQKLIKSTMFISFNILFGIAAVAESLIIVLIGEKWVNSIPYLQLLCFVGVLFPLHAINLNMLKIEGRSDLFLWLEIIKKSLAVPVIILGIKYGINILIIGMIANSVIALFINGYYSGRGIGYSIFNQLVDISPSFFQASFTSTIIFFVGRYLQFAHLYILLIQFGISLVLTIFFAEILKNSGYQQMKSMLIENLKREKIGKD